MRRKSNPKVRAILDDRQAFIRPGPAIFSLTALVLGGMMVWNAFFGQHGRDADLLAAVPPGATTRVEVKAPGKTSRTITLKYDANVEEVQRALLASGHYRGLVDGVMGAKTAVAIQNYQSDNQLPRTGEVTPDLLEHFRYRQKIAAASDITGSIEPLAAEKGTFTDDRIVEVQERLARLGYASIGITGFNDQMTRAAILQFAMEHGLAMDGEVTAELLSELKLADAAAQTAAP